MELETFSQNIFIKNEHTKYCNEISSHEVFDYKLYFDEFSKSRIYRHIMTHHSPDDPCQVSLQRLNVTPRVSIGSFISFRKLLLSP